MAFSFDLVEIVAIEEGFGFGVVAILMAPAGIVLNSEAKGIVFDRINKSCICWFEGLKIGCCNHFTANQVVQAVKEPAAECIAVRTLFGVQLEDVVVIENVISKANNEWSDVASDISEVSDFDPLCVVNVRKNILKGLDRVFPCGNKDIDAAGYILQVSGDCFSQFWVKNVQKDANFFAFYVVLD